LGGIVSYLNYLSIALQITPQGDAFYSDQSIGVLSAASSAAFARLKGLDPKKPR
jgi:hypothetical protein